MRHNPFTSMQKEQYDRYIDGKTAMMYLAARLRHDAPERDQQAFNAVMAEETALWRRRFTSQGMPNNMGLLQVQRLLAGIRTFVALNWSGNGFQRLYLNYGCKCLFAAVSTCTAVSAAECVGFGQLREYFVDADREVALKQNDLKEVIDMASGYSIVYQFSLLAHRAQLSAKELQKQSWTVSTNCKTCTVRPELLRCQAVTLPWMLYIEITRPPNLNMALAYNSDNLLMGPTRDGQYAAYRLVCRVERKREHFVSDIRMADGTFTRYDFDRTSKAVRIPQDADTGCAFLCWQRVD